MNWNCDLCGKFVGNVIRVFQRGKLIRFEADCKECGRVVIGNPKLLKSWNRWLVGCPGRDIEVEYWDLKTALEWAWRENDDGSHGCCE